MSGWILLDPADTRPCFHGRVEAKGRCCGNFCRSAPVGRLSIDWRSESPASCHWQLARLEAMIQLLLFACVLFGATGFNSTDASTCVCPEKSRFTAICALSASTCKCGVLLRNSSDGSAWYDCSFQHSPFALPTNLPHANKITRM